MRTGIYQIRYTKNSKCYIGSAARSFDKRWNEHRCRLRKNQHPNHKLQHAWNKYGENTFVFEVLLYCDPEDCLTYEQIALDTILFASCNDERFRKLGYNICKIAGSPLGRKHSEETKRKIGQSHKGKILSKEHKEKISKNHANVKGSNHPLYGQHHSRGTKNGKSKLTEEQVFTIRQQLMDGETVTELASKFGVQKSAISKIKTGRTWNHKS